jgi:hypothetical protein
MMRRLALHRRHLTKHICHAKGTKKHFESVCVVLVRQTEMRMCATYVDPDALLTLTQLENLVLWA